jgi:hypothetical protein
VNGHFIWLVIAAAALVPLTICSKFANQVIAFCSALMSVFGNFVPLLVWVLGSLFAVAITKGKTFRVMHGQVKHSLFYWKYVQQKYLYPAHRNALSYLRSFVNAVASGFGVITWFFQERYYLHVLASTFPQVVIIVWFFARYDGLLYGGGATSVLVGRLAEWCAVSIVCMIITSIKPFLFLGESERYVENTIILQMVLLVLGAYLINIPQVLYAMVVYSLVAYFVYQLTYFRTYSYWSKVYTDCLPLLRRIDERGVRIYGIGTFFWPLLYGTKKADILCPTGNNDEALLSVKEWDCVFGNYPFPGRMIREVVDKYQIDYLVGSEKTIAQYEKLLNDSSFSEGRFEQKYTRGEFRVYSTQKGV